MEWTVTVEGQNMYGEVQRAELRIKKELDGLAGGEIGLSISDGKRIMSKVQEFVVKQELATCALARRICPSCERFWPVKDYTTLSREWKKAGLTIGFRRCWAFIGAGERK